MASQNEMEIVLKLVDEASSKLKKALGDAGKAGEDAGKKQEDSAKKAEANWARLTITVGGIIKAYQLLTRNINDVIAVGRQMDADFDRSFDNFELSVLRVQQSVAQRLIPSLKTALDFWSEFLNKGFKDSAGFNQDLNKAEANLKRLETQLSNINNGGFVKNRFNIEKMDQEREAIEAQIGLEKTRIETLKKLITTQEANGQSQFENNLRLKEAINAVSDFKKSQQENIILFQAGKQTASEYYEKVLEGQRNVISQNQLMSQDLQNLAALQAQLGNEELSRSRNQIQEQISLLQFYQQEQKIAQQGMATFLVQVGQTLQTSLSGAITNLITGVQTAKEAFKQFGMAMVQSVVNFIAQKVVASIIEKTLLAGTVAASVAAAQIIAIAWAKAAALVSLATLGGNAAPAAAGIASVVALTQALSVIPRATGGDDIVTKPTLFLAGENGPERATFSPIGGRNFHGPSSVNIFIERADMSSEIGIERTAEMLGYAVSGRSRVASGF